MHRWSPVAPRSRRTSPARSSCSPFRALSLAPRRVGDPASARAFARPYRGVPQRLQTWQRADSPPATTSRRCICTSTPTPGSPCAGSSAASTSRGSAATPTRAPGLPARGRAPAAGRRSSPPGWARCGSTPHRSCWSTAGPPPSARSVGRCAPATPDREYVDHAGPAAPGLGDHGRRPAARTIARGARGRAAAGRRRTPPLRRLRRAARPRARTTPIATAWSWSSTRTRPRCSSGRSTGCSTACGSADLVTAATGCRRRGDSGSRATSPPWPRSLRTRWSSPTGRAWATVRLDVPPRHAIVQLVERPAAQPAARAARRRSAIAHSLAQALDEVKPGRVTAALLPAVDLDLVIGRRARGRAAAGEGHVVPAEAEPRVVHPSARRMRRAEATSTSQRDTRPPPAGAKNRRRRLPRTSTTSPRAPGRDRPGRALGPDHAVERVDAWPVTAAAPCRPTMTRNFHISSPLGSTCSSAGCDNRPDQGHLVHLVGLTLVCAHAHHLLGAPASRAGTDNARPRRPPLWTSAASKQRWGRTSGSPTRRDGAGNAQKGPPRGGPFVKRMFGGVLLSHILSGAVPLALAGLTSGFGMGPGVSLPLWPP